MAREIAITFYLFVFRLLFLAFKRFPQKEKTTFVASFGDNILYTLKEVEKQTRSRIVILKTSQCKVDFADDNRRRIIRKFEVIHLLDWIRSIYHLATSKTIFVDNYFGFLAATKFNSNVRCIQLWHAAGAIKRFGLCDPSIQSRPPRAIARFRTVYHRFNYIVVGSEQMATIFKKSFAVSDNHILRTGIPRTDFFFDKKAMRFAKESLLEHFPVLQKKKMLLYAPTFRKHLLESAEIKLDIEKLEAALSSEYVLFLRLHPAVQSNFASSTTDFVYNVSEHWNVNELLLATDILITDYSSIPFEFSLLQKPMIFFAYDVEKYATESGFWEKYESLVPGPVVQQTDEVIEVIRQNQFDMEQVHVFSEQWNQYSDGNSSKRIVNKLYQTDAGRQQDPIVP